MTEVLPPRSRDRHDLLTNYKALLLLAFVNVGLVEVRLSFTGHRRTTAGGRGAWD
jgi:hypothetical protein